VRVVIADDSLLFREGLSRLLSENGFEIVGTAADADELIEQVTRHRPDIAIAVCSCYRNTSRHTTRLSSSQTLRQELATCSRIACPICANSATLCAESAGLAQRSTPRSSHASSPAGARATRSPT
jgi:DNA-binding NarL/FixJ family response regulator